MGDRNYFGKNNYNCVTSTLSRAKPRCKKSREDYLVELISSVDIN